MKLFFRLVALAAQDTLSNMFAGLIIMIDRPFKPGDRIELDKGYIGDVLQIGTRTTRILTAENNVIVVPNKDLANSRIVNHVFPTPLIGITLEVGVAYGSDYGNSALNISVSFWISDFRNRPAVVDEVNMSIKERFKKEGIDIPFPHVDISMIK